MCLALLPILGPYTRAKARRPKGGRDGGRDIEAVYQYVLCRTYTTGVLILRKFANSRPCPSPMPFPKSLFRKPYRESCSLASLDWSGDREEHYPGEFPSLG
jgi:hypothetical protein